MNDEATKNDTTEIGANELHQYRSYLLVLAQIQLNSVKRQSPDASDIVQHTLLEAHQHRGDYRGDANGIIGWLRQILANNIRDAFRYDKRKKRDVRRLQTLDNSINESSQNLIEMIPGQITSPSVQAVRNEDVLRLSNALLELTDAQRQVIILHHIQGMTLSKTAAQLNKSDTAVAGLLHRGLQSLRRILGE